MATLSITDTELARNVQSVLDSVQAGTEVIIKRDSVPIAVLRTPEPRRRKLSEIMASLSEESTAIIDPGFADDVQSFIDNHREPLNAPEWD